MSAAARQSTLTSHARVAAHSLTGIGEVVLLPLDVLKILRQTNPEAFRNRSFLTIMKDEGFGLYRGWGWTMARNAPGSFAVRPRQSPIASALVLTSNDPSLCSCSGVRP